MFQKITSYLSSSHIKYAFFWVVIFVYSMTQSNYFYSSNTEVITVYSFRITLQMIVAFLIIEQLIPRLLNKGKTLLFGLGVLLLMIITYIVCTAFLMYYLEVEYPDTYTRYLQRFSDLTWYGRMTNLPEIISKSLYYLYPTFFILVFKLYTEKQQLLKLAQQKKSAELAALKNQLNPHFLFNTLNNLYVLALKKSDNTTLVIQKLSNILDYILYKCEDDYVPIENEISLIENYISLEKIRYGDRVKITFEKGVTGQEKIAPLLLLTFIENAFKHGVKEEINQASIDIGLSNEDGVLIFDIKNSKPNGVQKNISKKSIGLSNIKQQLDLLYPKTYDLEIADHPTTYSVHLKIKNI